MREKKEKFLCTPMDIKKERRKERKDYTPPNTRGRASKGKEEKVKPPPGYKRRGREGN